MRKSFTEFLCILSTLIIAAMIMFGTLETEAIDLSKEMSDVNIGWYYIEDNNRVSVTLPATIEHKDQDLLVLYHDSMADLFAGQSVLIKGAQYDLIMKLEDQILYAYEDGHFIRNHQMKSKLYCIGQLPSDGTGQTLTLTMYDENGIYQIPEVQVGADTAVTRELLQNNSLFIFIVVSMFLLALLAIVASIFLHRVHMGDRRFRDAGTFLIICGIWCVTDSGIGQLISGGHPWVSYLSFYAFMLMAIPMLHFVRHSGNMKRHMILDYCVYVFYLNALIQSFLNYKGIFDFVDMLYVTHLLLFGGVILCFYLLVKDYLEDKNKETRIILTAFGILGFSGLLALLLYWLFEISFYSLIFETGIMIFAFLLLVSVISTVVGNYKYKAEMKIYQKLSEEDSMTGLPGSKAYEEFMEKLEYSMEDLSNATLVYVDLDRLRNINEQYGQSAGDEMIIAVGRCVENAFAAGGSCFRIGRDEFCAIILEPKEEKEQLLAQLDEEIQMYNKGRNNPLSIARGASCLRREDGSLKSIREWKYEAEENRHQNN